MATAWDTDAERLMHLAGIAARSVLNRRKVDIFPFEADDLAGELMVYSLDPEAQRARGVSVTPELEDALVISRLTVIGGDWVTELLKTGRVGDGTDAWGHRLTEDEADELGAVRKFGEPLPNEGREFIARTLGNPEADPGHRRLLDRALERMCQGAGRANRAELLHKKYVQRGKLTKTEQRQVGRLIEELTENLNAVLREVPGWDFEGVGTQKFIKPRPEHDEWANDPGPEIQPLRPGQRWSDTGERTVTLEEFKRSSPKRALTFQSYVDQKNSGRIVAPPESTPMHQIYA